MGVNRGRDYHQASQSLDLNAVRIEALDRPFWLNPDALVPAGAEGTGLVEQIAAFPDKLSGDMT